jgi:3-deoxy-7-phosphoheptulonate synthase
MRRWFEVELVVVFASDADCDDVSAAHERLREMGLSSVEMNGEGAKMLRVQSVGESADVQPDVQQIEMMPGVRSVLHMAAQYKLASRTHRQADTEFEVKGVRFGGKNLTVIAGPCSIEGRQQLLDAAGAVSASGAGVLRGGTFKARTSPYSFQGLGKAGLELLKEAGERAGLVTITEVTDPRDVDVACQYVDILQIGARNIQNFNLLVEVGKTDKPVLIKRGISATIDELLMSAEYVLDQGNERVILCERGIRTFNQEVRYTLDLSAVPVIQSRSHLPVFVDPSHAAGRREWVTPLAMAAVACGAQGVMVEVHGDPGRALCDGPQALVFEEFAELMEKVRAMAPIVGRTLSGC